MNLHLNRRLFVPLSLLALFLSACTPTIETRGIDPDQLAALKIEVGKTTQSEVMQTLGTPCSFGAFDTNTWFYVSRQQETEAFFMPRNLDRKVLIVKFNAAGVVEEFSYNDDPDTPYIKPLPRTTETAGYESSWSREVFSNLGRMNTRKTTGGSAPRVPLPQ